MIRLDRRGAMLAGVAVALGGAAMAPGRTAFAGVPQGGDQGQPGFYRKKVGDIEVTVVSDGVLEFPPETLFPGHADGAQELLTASFRPAHPVRLQLNTTVINAGGKLVLVDAGGGVDGKFQPTAGKLFRNLAAAGCTPDQIDIVLLTHGHSDHLWGISDLQNQRLLFPSAEFVASETEVKFWNSPDGMKVDPKLNPQITVANFALAKPRLRLIKAGAEVAPGVVTLDTPGHTPGHMSVLIHSGEDQLLLTADVVVEHPIDFIHPEWPFGFDYDKDFGVKSRVAFLDCAATDRTLVSGYHLPFPGFGHVVREGSGYRWIAAEWQFT